MNLLFGVVAGVLGYLVAHLVLNHPISVLIGVVIFLAVAFGFPDTPRRR